ncbi:coiled-coil domain-containing protein 13 isoform X2 [Nilaparvata lugens]|uniref:coiled-coil domain-containing protein 13 isoform X2 n=1 Tax=Nilaparvata lugens TaxID=108931 RepID=UPI00193E01F2|nr:coiled-coil domain-containing protein 13 isoform X2 [Nilaparvata lugens]
MSSKKKSLRKNSDLRKSTRLKKKAPASPPKDLLVNKNLITVVDSAQLPLILPGVNPTTTVLKSASNWKSEAKDDPGLNNIDSEESKKNLMISEELNRQMKNKIEVLSQENASLQQRVDELLAQLTALEVKCPPAIHGRASDLAASKIVELSKKIRELTAELEVTKLRARTLENGGKDYLSRRNSSDTAESIEDENRKSIEIKELTEKLNSANLKYYEAKNQSQKLKQDLKAAHKALANEIGEEYSVQSALTGNGWRGRAQKITSLQLKVSQLSEKLANQQSFQSQSHDVLVNVRQAEKDMRNELAKELKECKSELEQTKNKFNVSRMRCKVLEGELQSNKEKINSILSKSNHDDQLITALTSQVNSLKEKYNNDVTKAASEMEKKCYELEEKLQMEKMKTAHLQNTLNSRDDRIAHLKEKTHVLIKNKSKEKVDASEMTQTREFGINTAQDLLNQISEAERIRLLELIQVLNKRIDAQRNSLNQQEEELRNERQKSAKLETKVARLELLRVNNNSADKMYSSKLSIDDNNGNSHINEKSQERIELLEEQCATLKTRLRCLSQEKVEDVQSLTNLLEEAKLKFMEALKSRSSREVQFAIPSF